MRELADFLKRCLSDTAGNPSYTRCAGFTTLYFYLMWSSYRISAGASIKDIDIPTMLAAFLFGLYAIGKGAETYAAKGASDANPTTDITAQ